jgi:hypothetical protein
VPGPSGKAWGPSTIHGNRQRGTGILNNELYIGRLVWNRLRYVKDPETGRRVSRLNPESGWIVQNVAGLRIVDQSLWEQVKARQGSLTAGQASGEAPGYWDRRRPRYFVYRPDALRRLRRRHRAFQQNLYRLRQCPQQRHLRQQGNHAAQRSGKFCARRPAAPSDGAGAHPP